MPIAKNLAKLQKRKADTKLHPLGRKFKQLTTAELRQSKLDSVKAKRDDALEKKMERHKFVQALCRQLGKEVYSLSEARTMCQEYIDRNKADLEKLEKERRPGRPPSSKYQKTKLLYDSESQEFREGFNFVDVTDALNVKHLIKWEGTWGGLNMIKLIRVRPE